MEIDLIDSVKRTAKLISCRHEQLAWCSSVRKKPGSILEFGVHKGETINILAKHNKNSIIYGFDSFKGLPERWTRSSDGLRYSEKGDFLLNRLPKLRKNVELVIGDFSESLPKWLHSNKSQISILHIDCDLYSSTKTVLELLKNRIASETIIIFDEFCDWNSSGIYDLWREGEYRALVEWLNNANRIVQPLSRTNWLECSFRVME